MRHGRFLLVRKKVAGQITAIKVQKKSKRRVSVYLDGEYRFSLGALVAAQLSRGDTLSDREIEELLTRDSMEAAYDRTLKYLAYRPRSSAEVERYLSQKGVGAEIRERVLDRLRGAGLVDDGAFAQFWVENRESFRPQGRRLLRQELRQKGISEGLIDEVLSGVEEDTSAYAAAAQRAVRYAHLEDEAFREKMYGYLRRRGFDHEVVAETTARLLTERCEGRVGGS
jgi:regulatory protein